MGFLNSIFGFRVTAIKKCGDMIHVRFCDFGDSATVDSSHLKILPLKFRQLPKMAIQARLYGKFPDGNSRGVMYFHDTLPFFSK